MASYFLDSSALVKYYHTEAGSTEVNRLIHELNARHYISRLIAVEVPLRLQSRPVQGNSTSVILSPYCGAFSGMSPNISSRYYR
jgi:predicted nucleic acid-binding protein